MISKFSLVRATMADRPRLVTFLDDNFYPCEPMHHAIRNESMDADVEAEVSDFTLWSLSQGRTLLAVDGDDLLGVAINGEVTNEEYNHRVTLLNTATSDESKKFYQFWAYVEEKSGFWVDGEATKALNLETLCVSTKAGQRGVGKALFEGSLQIAREDGYQLFRIDCSSYFAARLVEKFGLTRMLCLPYSDYKDDNGETVYNIKPPHREYNIFKLKL